MTDLTGPGHDGTQVRCICRQKQNEEIKALRSLNMKYYLMIGWLISFSEPHNNNSFSPFSDGVGMTGSFIAIDLGMQSLEEKRSVDVFGLVKSLRKDRAGAVQVFGQYKFIYRVSLFLFNLFFVGCVFLSINT